MQERRVGFVALPAGSLGLLPTGSAVRRWARDRRGGSARGRPRAPCALRVNGDGGRQEDGGRSGGINGSGDRATTNGTGFAVVDTPHQAEPAAVNPAILQDKVSAIVTQQLEVEQSAKAASPVRTAVVAIMGTLQLAVTIAAAAALSAPASSPGNLSKLTARPGVRVAMFLSSTVLSAVFAVLLTLDRVNRNQKPPAMENSAGMESTDMLAMQNMIGTTIRAALRDAEAKTSGETAKLQRDLRDAELAREEQASVLLEVTSALAELKQERSAALELSNEVNKEVATSKARIVELRNQNQALESRRQEIENAAEIVQSENKQLEQKLADVTRQLGEIKKTETSLREDLKSASNRLDRVLSEKASWIRIADDLTDEFQVQRQELLDQINSLKETQKQLLEQQSSNEATSPVEATKEGPYAFSRTSFTEGAGSESIQANEEIDVAKELSNIESVLEKATRGTRNETALFSKANAAFAELSFLAPGDVRVAAAWGDALLVQAKASLGTESSKAQLISAYEKFEETVSAEPDNVEFLFNCGLTLSLRAVFEQSETALATFMEACQKYDRIIEIDPSNQLANFNLGLALFSRARIMESLEVDNDLEGAKLCYADAMNRFQGSIDLGGPNYDDPKATGYISECRESLQRLGVRC